MKWPKLLALVRHAESARNAAKGDRVYYPDEAARSQLHGVPDYLIPITDRGKEQARQSGEKLGERFGLFDCAYHSGYLRSRQTLDGILRAYPEQARAGFVVRLNLFIRERDPGYAYEMVEAEAKSTFPWMDNHWASFDGFFAHPVGGESLAQVAQRVQLFLDELRRDWADKKVLVITHGGPLRCFRFLLEHWDYDQALNWAGQPPPENCSLTLYLDDPAKKSLVLQEYNTVLWS